MEEFNDDILPQLPAINIRAGQQKQRGVVRKKLGESRTRENFPQSNISRSGGIKKGERLNPGGQSLQLPPWDEVRTGKGLYFHTGLPGHQASRGAELMPIY